MLNILEMKIVHKRLQIKEENMDAKPFIYRFRL